MKKDKILFMSVFLVVALFPLISSTIKVESSLSVEPSISYLTTESFVVGTINGANAGFSIYNTNGTLLLSKTVVNNTVSTSARVSVKSINDTSFIFSYFNDVNDVVYSMVYNMQGTLITPMITIGTYGAGASNNVDISSASFDGKPYYYVGGYDDSANSLKAVKVYLNGSISTTILATAVPPEKPLNNLVKCRPFYSDVLVCIYYDDVDDDSSYILLNMTNGTLIKQGDINLAVGNDAQVSLSTAEQTYVGYAYITAGNILYMTIKNSSDSVVVPEFAVDTNIGSVVNARLSVSTVYDTFYNASLFVVAYTDTNDLGLFSKAYFVNGTQAYSYTVTSTPYLTSALLSTAGMDSSGGVVTCNNTYLVAYNNATGGTFVRPLYVNGSVWNGVCHFVNAPYVYSPTTNYYHQNVVINYTQPLSSEVILSYNISLSNPDSSFNKSIVENNGLNLSYVWNSTSALDGYYKIKVEACTTLRCNSNYSQLINVDNSPPFGSLNSPYNNTYSNNSLQNFSISYNDNVNVTNMTWYLYNSTGIVNQTINQINNQSGTLNVLYNFVVYGVYSWFVTLFDEVGNIFQSMTYIFTYVRNEAFVVINYPNNGTTYLYTPNHVNFTAIELDTCWYSTDKGLTNTSVACNSQSFPLDSKQGNNSISLYGNNTQGNYTSTTNEYFVSCTNPDVTVSMDSYPYVPINTTFTISLTPFIAGNSNIKFLLHDLDNGQNTTFNFTYNQAQESYQLGLFFTSFSNYSYTIYGDSLCPTVLPNITGALFVRKPYYVTFCGYDSKNLHKYENEFAYVIAEPSSKKKYDSTLEKYLAPLLFKETYKTPVYHTTYDNGCATLTLFEKGTYNIRLFDGVATFPTTLSAPNISKTYGTNMYLGQFKLNQTETYKVYISDSDIHPYRTLLNYGLIILIVLSLFTAVIMFFMFPQFPFLSITLASVFPIGILILRAVLWLWTGN